MSQFKVTVTIQNNYTAAEDIVQLNDASIFNVLDVFDITFDVDTIPSLDSILSDLGMRLTDLDASIFDTE